MNEYLNFPQEIKEEIKIENGSGLNEKITLHPSSIPSHSSVSILVFFIKKI